MTLIHLDEFVLLLFLFPAGKLRDRNTRDPTESNEISTTTKQPFARYLSIYVSRIPVASY